MLVGRKSTNLGGLDVGHQPHSGRYRDEKSMAIRPGQWASWPGGVALPEFEARAMTVPWEWYIPFKGL